MTSPLLVEILAYAPTAFYHCTHCEVAWREMGVDNRIHDEQTNSSLPPDLLQDYQRISDWVRDILSRHCDRVMVKVIDAASIEGFIKSLRYRVHRYPAIIINGKITSAFREFEDASQAINSLLERETSTPAQFI
jgi:hypothetical protein